MSQQKTTQDLVAQLAALYPSSEDVLDTSNFKYAIYVRRSTNSEEKQARSLGDQLAECKELSERLDLSIIKIFKESESAKEPDIRPKFRQMIDEVNMGKYDGIISWHPDRLARNMKDAGEVIDMVDKHIIKDLKFVSFTFENTPSGKMLLGIAFVLSKQYSDQLRENVKRGNKRSIEEGKYINTPKHGYKKDTNQYLRPDGENFVLIKEAFKMRLNGKTLPEIVDYLNKHNYYRAGKAGTKSKPYKMTRQRVSEILRDPAYTGVVMYGEHIVDFTKEYNFVPMISVDEYNSINKKSALKKGFLLARNARKNETVKANLLRGKVICGYCNTAMTSGITPKVSTNGSKKNYYYYRCETKECDVKGVRAHVVRNFAIDFLKKTTFTSKKAYKQYKKEMRQLVNKRIEQVDSELRSLKKEVQQKKRKFEKTKELLLEEREADIKRIFKDDLKVLEERLKEIKKEITDLQIKREKINETIKTFPDFLELFEKLAKSIEKTKSMAKLDAMLQNIFLNFTLKDKKVANYTLNSPIGELVDVPDIGNILNCRGERT